MTKLAPSLFDSLAREYDAHMRVSGHYAAQHKLLAKIRSNVQNPVLDLACGAGEIVTLLSKNGYSIIGNDLSQNMLDLAARTTPSVHFTCEDTEYLPSYSSSFGTLICCNLWYYLSNQQNALLRWKELLLPNGNLLLLEEYPFQLPKSCLLSENIKAIVKPVPPNHIISTIESGGWTLCHQDHEPIDTQHDLHALLFKPKKGGKKNEQER